jgi:hypothetical protein
VVGVTPGTPLILDVRDGALRFRTQEQAVRELRALVLAHGPADVSLVDGQV